MKIRPALGVVLLATSPVLAATPSLARDVVIHAGRLIGGQAMQVPLTNAFAP